MDIKIVQSIIDGTFSQSMLGEGEQKVVPLSPSKENEKLSRTLELLCLAPRKEAVFLHPKSSQLLPMF